MISLSSRPGVTRPGATRVAAATPASRDRYVDFLRVASLFVVVVGHWLMAAVAYRQGRLSSINVLTLHPTAQVLTWVLQVMPVFFFVGGFSNAASWSAARRDGVPYSGWLAVRVARLVRPAAAFALVWATFAALLLAATGRPIPSNRMISLPLWFLAVYLGVVALAPLMLAAHRRFGSRVPVVLALAVVAVDVARWGFGVPLVGWLNFAFVWLFAHQLGFLWRDGRLTARPARAWWLAGAGLVTLVLLTAFAGYPRSLVGGMNEARSNTTPPSLALVAATLLQVGAALGLRRPVDRLLARPRVWAGVVAANTVAMTVYLWHLSALVLVSVVLLGSGWFPQPEAGTAAWWAWRPAWLAALAVALVPLVAVFAPVERAGRSRRTGRPGTLATAATAVGAALAAAGMAVLAVEGFTVAGLPLGLPLVGLGLLALGALALRAATVSPVHQS